MKKKAAIEAVLEDVKKDIIARAKDGNTSYAFTEYNLLPHNSIVKMLTRLNEMGFKTSWKYRKEGLEKSLHINSDYLYSISWE